MKKKFITIFFVLFIIFNIIICKVSFAKTKSNGSINTTNYEDFDTDIYAKQTNGVLSHYLSLMTGSDMLKIENCLKMYNEGYSTDAWQDLVSILSNYSQVPEYVAYYILGEPNTVPFANFYIDNELKIKNKTEGTIFGIPLTEKDIDNCERIWTYFLDVYTIDELSNFKIIYFTQKEDYENGISISPMAGDYDNWMIDISINLLKYPDQLYKNVANSLVYFHALNKENLASNQNINVKNLFSAYGHYYREDSPISQFYKRFWKNIRLEYDLSQIKDYQKDFISVKASRTCHDDFVESFYNYMKNGVVSETVSNNLVSQKTNFFDRFEEYRLLAERLKKKFGY